MKNITLIFLALCVVTIYSCVGTGGNIARIRQMAPSGMPERNWKILRYEGYQLDSWGRHGGVCWYHVANIDNPNIQYRVMVSLKGDELQYWYGQPEKLDRVEANIQIKP